MLRILLRNRIQDSPYQKVTLHLPSSVFELENGQRMDKHDLAEIHFKHPLLTASQCPPDQRVFLYEYDDFEALMLAAQFVYGVLVRVNDPLHCQFIIKPSSRFQPVKAPYRIPFSFHVKKMATTFISLAQLNAIMSHFKDYPFQYQDNIVLDKTITIHDLPEEVDAECLYEADKKMLEFCKQADNVHQYDIRYINRLVGFGVFARHNIPKGDMIAVYFGTKMTKKDAVRSYIFREKNDCLKLDTDGRLFGNFTRFINHAIKRDPEDADSKSNMCFANVLAKTHFIYGNNVIIYSAIENIGAGEQLLVDYGAYYFTDPSEVILWQQNGKMTRADGKRIPLDSASDRRLFLKTMAHYGVKKRSYANKAIIVFFLLMILVVGLHWMPPR